MSTLPARRRVRKPVSRSIRVVEQPTVDSDGWGCIEIAMNGNATVYLCRFIPCEFGDGVLGLELEKLAPDLTGIEERYTVAVGGRESSCECKGFCRHGHCKHVEGVAKLVEVGALKPVADKPAYRSAGDFAANDPCGWDGHEADVA